MFVWGKVFYYDFYYVLIDFNIYDNVFVFRNSDGYLIFDIVIEYDVNIYLESNRMMVNRGNFNFVDFLYFDLLVDKFLRLFLVIYENVVFLLGF